MYRMVIDVLNEYRPVWENTPKFVEAHALFNGKMELLQIQAEKQRSYTLGVKVTRDTFRGDVARLGTRIASALTALGDEQQNLELIAQCRITESQLIRSAHGDTLILLDRILFHADLHSTELESYGIPAALIDQFRTWRDELAVNIMAPRKAVLKRRDATQQILGLCEDMDRLLRNKVDRLVQVLRPGNESFYTEYSAARMILDYGHSTPSDQNNTSNEF